jgi:hypothetical protein
MDPESHTLVPDDLVEAKVLSLGGGETVHGSWRRGLSSICKYPETHIWTAGC